MSESGRAAGAVAPGLRRCNGRIATVGSRKDEEKMVEWPCRAQSGRWGNALRGPALCRRQCSAFAIGDCIGQLPNSHLTEHSAG